MKVKQIKDKNTLYSFFKSNFCLFSYHIGDLHDFFFQDCSYYALIEESTNKILEVCMLYNGLSTGTVLALGLTPNFTVLLENISENLPDKFFCHFLQKYEKFLRNDHIMIDLGLHQKMYLKNFVKNSNVEVRDIRQLDLSHQKLLDEFYKKSYPDTYFEPYMLETGYYYGLFINDIIVSVAGVHTYSEEYKIAVLGNIATDPDYRGNGYGFLTIQHLISKLLKKIDFISLNVKSDNNSAIKLYKKLGFEYCTEYKEALFERRK